VKLLGHLRLLRLLSVTTINRRDDKVNSTFDYWWTDYGGAHDVA
jgi:hypothetical protein